MAVLASLEDKAVRLSSGARQRHPEVPLACWPRSSAPVRLLTCRLRHAPHLARPSPCTPRARARTGRAGQPRQHRHTAPHGRVPERPPHLVHPRANRPCVPPSGGRARRLRQPTHMPCPRAPRPAPNVHAVAFTLLTLLLGPSALVGIAVVFGCLLVQVRHRPRTRTHPPPRHHPGPGPHTALAAGLTTHAPTRAHGFPLGRSRPHTVRCDRASRAPPPTGSSANCRRARTAGFASSTAPSLALSACKLDSPFLRGPCGVGCSLTGACGPPSRPLAKLRAHRRGLRAGSSRCLCGRRRSRKQRKSCGSLKRPSSASSPTGGNATCLCCDPAALLSLDRAVASHDPPHGSREGATARDPRGCTAPSRAL